MSRNIARQIIVNERTLYSHGLRLRVIRTDDGCFHALCMIKQSGSRIRIHGWHRDDYKEAIEKCVRDVKKRLFNYCNYLRKQHAGA